MSTGLQVEGCQARSCELWWRSVGPGPRSSGFQACCCQTWLWEHLIFLVPFHSQVFLDFEKWKRWRQLNLSSKVRDSSLPKSLILQPVWTTLDVTHFRGPHSHHSLYSRLWDHVQPEGQIWSTAWFCKDRYKTQSCPFACLPWLFWCYCCRTETLWKPWQRPYGPQSWKYYLALYRK